MKKKGFTLVELLGVIVTLAIIALIAVPTIIGVVDKSRKSSLQNSGYGLVEAGTLYYAHYQNRKTVRFDIKENEVITKDGKELIYKGRVKEGTLLINKKGEVVVCINDGKYAAYKNFKDNKVTIVDNKTCTIPENSNVVYLDGEKTEEEISNQELVEEIENLKQEISNLNEIVENIPTTSNVLNKVYPIGSIYISTNDTNPSTLFGGTWEKYASGRTLIGVDSNNEKYNSSNKTGGKENVTLTASNLPSHNHTFVPTGSVTSNFYGIATDSSIAKASGNLNVLMAASSEAGSSIVNGGQWVIGYNINKSELGYYKNGTSNFPSANHYHTTTPAGTVGSAFSGKQDSTSSVGSSESFNIQNPYVTVYMWKRVS